MHDADPSGARRGGPGWVGGRSAAAPPPRGLDAPEAATLATPRTARGQNGASTGPIPTCTAFRRLHASTAARPFSRPKPEALIPPKGISTGVRL